MQAPGQLYILCSMKVGERRVGLRRVNKDPEKAMTGRNRWAAGLLAVVMSGWVGLSAQTAPSKPPDQNIPDAPSAKQKPQNFPQPSVYPPAQTSPTPDEQQQA